MQLEQKGEPNRLVDDIHAQTRHSIDRLPIQHGWVAGKYEHVFNKLGNDY
jgi:hypothetical protein